MESTYGGREHEPAEEARRQLADVINVVAPGHGRPADPPFAIGRTQEIVWELGRLVGGSDPGPPAVPRLADGRARERDLPPLPRDYDEETFRCWRPGETPLDYPGQNVIQTSRNPGRSRGRPAVHDRGVERDVTAAGP